MGRTSDNLLVIDLSVDVRPNGLGSMGIVVDLEGGRKLDFRQPINKKNLMLGACKKTKQL